MFVAYTNEGVWEIRTLIEDHNCLQSGEIKACTSTFLSDHVMKTLATNLDIPVRPIHDQMQKQFDVGVLKMKAFREKRIENDKITCTTVGIDVQQEPNSDSSPRTFKGCPFPGQILTTVGVDGNNRIYPIAYAIVEAECKFKGGVYKDMLWNEVRATTVDEFNKKMGQLKSYNFSAYDWLMKIPAGQWSRSHISGRAKCDLLLNNICGVFSRQLVDGRDQPIITCLEYIKAYLMKRIVLVQKDQCVVNMDRRVCSCRKWELARITCKHVVAAIYNMYKNEMGVGIPKHWVHAAYRLETWEYVYSFKINPCNGREMWPVVESKTVIIPHNHKSQVGRPLKKRKKSVDELASQSCSSGKI
nr:transposase, mutator type [Tanacetum cinerariifolium]